MVEPLFDNYGNIIAIRYLGRSFISLKDAEDFRCFREKNGIKIPMEENRMSMSFYAIGRPDFVNVKKSLETGFLEFYSDDEIQWYPTPIEEYNL